MTYDDLLAELDRRRGVAGTPSPEDERAIVAENAALFAQRVDDLNRSCNPQGAARADVARLEAQLDRAERIARDNASIRDAAAPSLGQAASNTKGG